MAMLSKTSSEFMPKLRQASHEVYGRRTGQLHDSVVANVSVERASQALRAIAVGLAVMTGIRVQLCNQEACIPARNLETTLRTEGAFRVNPQSLALSASSVNRELHRAFFGGETVTPCGQTRHVFCLQLHDSTAFGDTPDR